MNTTSIFFMILAMVIIWGGLLTSVIFLNIRPEINKWPSGWSDEDESRSLS
jgi:hypothetical protein